MPRLRATAQNTENDRNLQKHLEEAEYVQFLEWLEVNEPEWLPLYAFAIDAGFRKGEYIGAVWEDFDADKGTYEVRSKRDRPRQRVSTRTPPKWNSFRFSMLNSDTVAMVEQHRLRMQKVLGLDEPPQTGLIFCSHDGSPINYCTDYCRFKRFLEASGVEIKRSGYRPRSPHCLRHTAGVAIVSRKGLEVAKAQLGHKSVRTTADFYSGYMEDDRVSGIPARGLRTHKRTGTD